MRRRALLAIFLGAAAACFPTYDFSPAESGDGGGAGDASATHDATGDDATTTHDANGGDDATTDGAPSNDAPASGDDGPSLDALSDVTPFDANTPPSDAGPYDAESTAIVPSGTYTLQVDRGGGPVGVTAQLTHSFALDRYEVTVARFRSWVAAGMPLPAHGASLDPGGAYAAMAWGDATWDGYAKDRAFDDAGCIGVDGTDPQTYDSPLAGKDDFAVTCVNWYQAAAFCAWEGGKRLPTETEWRVVASGEGDGRTYPWGNAAVDCAHATVNANGANCGWPLHVGAAAAGVSKDGVLDLVGGAREWVWDRAADTSYPSSAIDYAPSDAGTGDPSSAYVVSGYSSDPGSADLLPSQELGFGSNYAGYAQCGFRCAKSR